MTQVQWMRNEAGQEIKVDPSQVAAFEKRGFKLFDKPAPAGPKVSRRSGNQANMGRLVRMQKGSKKIMAEKSQIDAMKKSGWKVSKDQPAPPKPQPAVSPSRKLPPRKGSVRMVRGEAEVFADPAQVAAFEASGWQNPDAPAGPGGGENMSGGEMRLSVPAMIVAGQPFEAHIEQELLGSGASAAGVQFSNDPDGPWVTARPPGGGGAVEAPAVPFTAQSPEWDYPGIVAHEAAWMRVGAWPDQGLEGNPIHVSNPEELSPKAAEPGGEPEPHPRGGPDEGSAPE